jgi:hypothetical protein
MAYSSTPEPNLDGLGIFWIVWTFIWTFIVISGMVFLWRRRDMPMLRIRDLPLTFVAITMLHLYWGAVQTGYVYFPLFTPEGEFWIMSLYFPIGIALFHASNSRFLHVAKQQKELFASDEKAYNRPRARRDSLLGKFQALDYTKKILVTIGLGMIVQVRICPKPRQHMDPTNMGSSSLPLSCGVSPRSSITVGVLPVLRSIPALRNTKSLRWAKAGNGKHTIPSIKWPPLY